MKQLKKLELTHLFLPFALIILVISYISGKSFEGQIRIGLILLFFYLLIQILHHYIDKSLTFEVVAEYILIAALLGVVLVL